MNKETKAAFEQSAVNQGRRRLFGAGAAAVPVLLSLQSRSAWGNAMCSPSAFTSVTYASHSPDGSDCTRPVGGSPLYWMRNSSQWNELGYAPDSVAGGVEPDSRARDIRGVCGRNKHYKDGEQVFCRDGSSFREVFGFGGGKLSLMQAIARNPDSLKAHAVAALLNAARGDITLGFDVEGSAESKVKDIFLAIRKGGGYQLGTGQMMYWNDDPDGVGYTFRDYFTNYEYIT